MIKKQNKSAKIRTKSFTFKMRHGIIRVNIEKESELMALCAKIPYFYCFLLSEKSRLDIYPFLTNLYLHRKDEKNGYFPAIDE